jgi:tetratricopeptide (TPR) repeat protein
MAEPKSRPPGYQTQKFAAGAVWLALPFLVVLSFNIFGSLYPSNWTWGYCIWSSLPVYAFGIVLVSFVVMWISSISGLVVQPIEYGLRYITESGKVIHWIAASVISLLLGILFFSLRSQSPMFGDGYNVVSNANLGLTTAPNSFHEAIKFGPVLLYRVGILIFRNQFHVEPQAAVGMVSVLGGVATVWGIWLVACELRQNVHERLTLSLIALTSGWTILLFGHLELYVWPLACLLFCLAAAIRYLNGRCKAPVLWIWIAVTLVMEAMFFPALLVFVLLLLHSRTDGQDRNSPFAFRLRPAAIAWGLIGCSIVVGLALTLSDDRFSFTPLWPIPKFPYSLFSLEHIADATNTLLLAAPLLLGTCVLWFIRRDLRHSLAPSEVLIILIGLALALLSVWIDPGLGAARDWDLLALYGVPASFGAGLVLTKLFPGRTDHFRMCGLSLATIALVSVPTIIERVDSDRALLRLDGFLQGDIHYQVSYDDAHGTVPWASLIQTFTDHPELAEKYLVRKLEIEPLSAISWFNLGEIKMKLNQSDSAALYFSRAYSLLPDYPVFVASYAQVLQKMNRDDELAPFLPKLAAMNCDDPKTLMIAGNILASRGLFAEALPLFRRVVGAEPQFFDGVTNEALCYSSLKQGDSALTYFYRALELAPASEKEWLTLHLIQETVRMGKKNEAQTLLSEFKNKYPANPDIPKIESYLNKLK